MKPTYYIYAWILSFILVLSINLYAGEIKYPVADIPKALLKDAKAVVRNEEIVVEVRSDDKLVQKIKYAITILNKNGKSGANLIVQYDKTMKVSNIKSVLYNESGVEYKKKGGFETLDFAMISNFSLYEDSRVKAIYPEQYEYPFTIEYTYEITWSGVSNYPVWHPIQDFNLSIEKSKFTLIIAKDASCRFYEKNIANKVKEVNSPENNTYSWELLNSAAFNEENFSPPLSEFVPIVYTAPTIVDVDGYKGNFGTWAGVGLWINQLLEGRDNLKDETKIKVIKLTDGISDNREKVKMLYEYMQNKTRYVSIQEGIGGYQPFDAETVDRLSYGDCKALSNYMKSLLDAVGIKSLYTRVKAGQDEPNIIAAFPSNQFNHVILCVPLKQDTVWLECTSQQNPFNYLGTFTAERTVLVIDDNGGKLVNTPVMKPSSFLESRKTDVIFDMEGGGFANVKTTYSGATYDNYVPILMSDQADRKKQVTRRIHIPNFELDRFTIEETKSELPYVTEQLNLTINNYCTKVGEKMMLCLNIMNKVSNSPFQSASRKTPVSFKWPVYEIDTVNYELPQGYTLEKIPSKISIASDFGKYTTLVTKSGSTIQYVRTFEIYKGEFSVEKYDDIVIFFDKIVTADENKVMLTRIL
jgi:transglutaminase-like putative cysteine protease